MGVNNSQFITTKASAPKIDFSAASASYIDGLITNLQKGKFAEYWTFAESMMRRDLRLQGEFAKRNRAIVTDFEVVVVGESSAKERKAAKVVTEIIKGIDNFEDAQMDLNSAFYYSLIALEFNDGNGNAWVNEDGIWKPAGFTYLEGWKMGSPDPEQSEYAKITPMLLDKDGNFIPFEENKWIVHIHRTIGGNPFAGGLATSLIWTFLLKWFPLKDWVGLLEQYGIPKLIASYNASLDPTNERDIKTIAAINLALQDVARIGSGAIPNDVTLTTIAPGSVNYEAFQKLVEYADNSYSIAINGGMMTSIAAANGLGSGAADVQNEVRKEIIETDHRQLESTFSKQLVTPIIRLNFPEIPIGKKFRFQYLKSEDKQVASTTNKAKRVTATTSEMGGENTVK